MRKEKPMKFYEPLMSGYSVLDAETERPYPLPHFVHAFKSVFPERKNCKKTAAYTGGLKWSSIKKAEGAVNRTPSLLVVSHICPQRFYFLGGQPSCYNNLFQGKVSFQEISGNFNTTAFLTNSNAPTLTIILSSSQI